MGSKIPPFRVDLERKIEIIANELLILGLKSTVASSEKILDRYNEISFSRSGPTSNEEIGKRHDLYLSNMGIEIIPITSLIEFNPRLLDLSMKTRN